MLQPLYLRRLKADVEKSLPPRVWCLAKHARICTWHASRLASSRIHLAPEHPYSLLCARVPRQ